jgi:hypothetical protein
MSAPAGAQGRAPLEDQDMVSTIENDRFLDELQQRVEQARSNHRTCAERHEQGRLSREMRARALIQHIERRFTAVATLYDGDDPAAEYTSGGSLNDEDLPIPHTLHWQVTRPHRRLEVRISIRTGRYRLVMLEVDQRTGAARVTTESCGDDVMNVTSDTVDELIRQLAEPLARCGEQRAP